MLRKKGGAGRTAAGPDLERLDFWRGQDLGSRDLNDIVDEERERFWWHDRAIHDTYGVVAGFGVLEHPDGSGDLEVAAGVAYDSYGRELLLAKPQRLSPPAAPPAEALERARRWTLVLRYAADRGRDSCLGGGSIGGVELFWLESRRMTVKAGVPIAHGSFQSGGAGPSFVLEERVSPPLSRPIARPRLGTGSTPRGGTAWRLWGRSIPMQIGVQTTFVLTMRGIEVTVDTGSAGFTRTPCYLAWLAGQPWQIRRGIAPTPLLDRVRDAARDRFTFDLWDPPSTGVSFEGTPDVPANLISLLDYARLALSVCWIGIEPDEAPITGSVTLQPR